MNKPERQWEENEESEKLHPSLLKKKYFFNIAKATKKIAANEQSVIIKCEFLSFSKNFFLLLVSPLFRVSLVNENYYVHNRLWSRFFCRSIANSLCSTFKQSSLISNSSLQSVQNEFETESIFTVAAAVAELVIE